MPVSPDKASIVNPDGRCHKRKCLHRTLNSKPQTRSSQSFHRVRLEALRPHRARVTVEVTTCRRTAYEVTHCWQFALVWTTSVTSADHDNRPRRARAQPARDTLSLCRRVGPHSSSGSGVYSPLAGPRLELAARHHILNDSSICRVCLLTKVLYKKWQEGFIDGRSNGNLR